MSCGCGVGTSWGSIPAPPLLLLPSPTCTIAGWWLSWSGAHLCTTLKAWHCAARWTRRTTRGQVAQKIGAVLEVAALWLGRRGMAGRGEQHSDQQFGCVQHANPHAHALHNLRLHPCRAWPPSPPATCLPACWPCLPRAGLCGCMTWHEAAAAQQAGQQAAGWTCCASWKHTRRQW